MKNLQNILILYFIIINFSMIDAMSYCKSNNTKHVTFNQKCEIYQSYMYQAEEQNPTEWQTNEEKEQAHNEYFTEENLTNELLFIKLKKRQEINQKVLESLLLTNNPTATNMFSQKLELKKHSSELFITSLAIATVSTFGFLAYHTLIKASDKQT